MLCKLIRFFNSLGTDHLTCRVFFFVQKFFFGQHEQSEIFFPEFNIRLYDKNSESDYFFFPPPESEYFFQPHCTSAFTEYSCGKRNLLYPIRVASFVSIVLYPILNVYYFQTNVTSSGRRFLCR